MVLVAVVLSIGAFLSAADAGAVVPPVGVQFGHAARVAKQAPRWKDAGGPCEVGVPVIGGLVSEITGRLCSAAGGAVGAVGDLAGEAAQAVGGGVLEELARWMIAAASQITTFVSKAMTDTTTPRLESSWFESQFEPMVDLGAALGLLVALISLGSAAIRRSPELLAATLSGIARAGIGTGLVVALTVLGLSLADQISTAVLTSSPQEFWKAVAHAWGTSGFGGFESSALAMLIALVEVLAAALVWIELVVRGAAIYLAVLFFPVALAAAIWPALGSWPGRLARLLALFVMLKPVALIVLSLAGSAAAAGLSFGGGVPSSVGTILSACVIFVLAAFAPWALMYLIAADAESAYVAHQLRTSTAAAIGEGRGALKDASAKNKASSNGAGGNGPGNGRPRPHSGGGNGGGGGARLTPSSGGPSAASGQKGSSEGQEVVGGTLALSGEAVGAGSIGAAAGLSAQSFGDLAMAAWPGAGAVGGGGGGDLKASGREGSEARGRDRREPGKERSWPGETAGGAAAPLLPQRDSGSAGNTLQPPQKPEDERPAKPRPSRPARGEGPVLSGAGASGGPRRRPPKAPSTGKGRGGGRDGERDS
jgi:hypothetical protein